MTIPFKHNLDQSHCQQCSEILRSIPQTKALAEACVKCGWPAEEYLTQLEQQEKMAKAIKTHFFPDEP